MKQRAILIDDIWHEAGSWSIDTDRYTKRLLLGYVYSATEVHILTDYSPVQVYILSADASTILHVIVVNNKYVRKNWISLIVNTRSGSFCYECYGAGSSSN